MTRIAPQIATRIPATNSKTFRLRTNAAHARAANPAALADVGDDARYFLYGTVRRIQARHTQLGSQQVPPQNTYSGK